MAAKHWMWVSQALEGGQKLRRLLEHFSDAEEIYEHRNGAALAALLSPGELARARSASLSECSDRADFCDEIGIKLCCYSDREYPARLRACLSPPALLYCTGDLAALSGQTVAGIGTRRSSQYGRDAVRFVCEPLAEAGVTLISGLAMGIDSEVHRAALRKKSKTVAVLGSGIDDTQPRRNEGLRREIEDCGGAVVSEYPPGAGCQPYMFVARNRIIAGLSRAVMVFEAPARSGALITVSWALEEGREVFAAPGSILSPTSEGANRLISQGASPLTCAADVLEFLGMEFDKNRPPLAEKEPGPELSGDELVISKALEGGALALDDLAAKTGIAANKLISALSLLELSGAVETLPGPRYKLK